MAVAEKGRQLHRQEEEIQRLVSHRAASDQTLCKKTIEGIQAGEYLAYKDYDERNYHALMNMEAEKEQTKKELGEERERLLGFMKERKILEKVKEKRLKTYLTQMEKRDQKNMDEIVIQTSSSPSGKVL